MSTLGLIVGIGALAVGGIVAVKVIQDVQSTPLGQFFTATSNVAKSQLELIQLARSTPPEDKFLARSGTLIQGSQPSIFDIYRNFMTGLGLGGGAIPGTQISPTTASGTGGISESLSSVTPSGIEITPY